MTQYTVTQALPEQDMLVAITYHLLDGTTLHETVAFLVKLHTGAYFKAVDGRKIEFDRVLYWKHIPTVARPHYQGI